MTRPIDTAKATVHPQPCDGCDSWAGRVAMLDLPGGMRGHVLLCAHCLARLAALLNTPAA